MEIVGKLAEDSMNDAVEEVKALPDYSVYGEVTINMTHKNCVVIIRLQYKNYLGTKNVTKQKITKGWLSDKGVMWFPELVDKRKCGIWSLFV